MDKELKSNVPEKNALQVTSGGRIRDLRKEMKLSLHDTAKEIASRLGHPYGYNSLSRIERGEISPSVEVLNALADLFGTTVDWLLCKPWATSRHRPVSWLNSDVPPILALLFSTYCDHTGQTVSAVLQEMISQRITQPTN